MSYNLIWTDFYKIMLEETIKSPNKWRYERYNSSNHSLNCKIKTDDEDHSKLKFKKIYLY